MLKIYKSNSTTLKLPYGCLIMRLVKAHAISIPTSEPQLELKQPIVFVNIYQSQSHKGKSKLPKSDWDYEACPWKNKFISINQSWFGHLWIDIEKMMTNLAKIYKFLKIPSQDEEEGTNEDEEKENKEEEEAENEEDKEDVEDEEKKEILMI